MLKRELKRQKNLEAIAAKALEELPNAVSDVPVEEDWVNQFLNHAQDVSSEQMQTIWGRLLAGEVAIPGSFSLRTLAFVKTMSSRDADMFTRFCSSVWMSANGMVAIVPDHRDANLLSALGMKFDELVHLDSLGLIKFDIVTSFSLNAPHSNVLPLTYYGKPFVLKRPDYVITDSILSVPTGCVLLSTLGKELFPIAGGSPNESYLPHALAIFRNTGLEITEPSQQP